MLCRLNRLSIFLTQMISDCHDTSPTSKPSSSGPCQLNPILRHRSYPAVSAKAKVSHEPGPGMKFSSLRLKAKENSCVLSHLFNLILTMIIHCIFKILYLIIISTCHLMYLNYLICFVFVTSEATEEHATSLTTKLCE